MVFRCGSIELDPSTREIRCRGSLVHAEPKVADLIFYLVRHRDRVVTKQELFDAIWSETTVGDAALTRCVYLARKALGDPRLIAVVHGRGYRFVAAQLESGEHRSASGVSGIVPAVTSAFVGREQSLAAAEERVALAERGRGGACFVYGEAGIGKSRFLLELSARVSARSAKSALVLRGESPDAEGAPAFWPWLQILRRLVQLAGEPEHRAEFGASERELLRIVRAASAEAGEGGDKGKGVAASLQNRLLFFEQIAEALGTIAEARPLVLSFDDLHQADLPSLHLFTFFARLCVDRRILLIGTYRDVELAADEGRSAALAPAWRAQALSIELRTLSAGEVKELVGPRVTPSGLEDLALALHRKTGGNPFFLTQLIPLLGVGDVPVSEIELPRGVRDVIRRRVHELGPGCSDVLAAAAVFGARFESAWLSIARFSAASVLQGLQRAVDANLLRPSHESHGRYEFVHGLVRDALYEDLDAEKRAALHQEAARLFESLPGLEEELRLASLVYHFGRALPLGHVEDLFGYTLRAGALALSRYAYETACDYFEDASRLIETSSVGDERTLFSVLLDLGYAQDQAGRRSVARATFDRAADLARRTGLSNGLADVALRLVSGVAIVDLLFGANHYQIGLLRDALDEPSTSQHRMGALLRARLAVALYSSSATNEREPLLQQADELAGGSADDTTRGELAFARLCSLWCPENLDRRTVLVDEALKYCRQADQVEHLHSLEIFRFAIGLERGDVESAREATEAYARISAELHHPAAFANPYRAVLTFLEGKLAEAEALCSAIIPLAERLQRVGQVQGTIAIVSLIRIERGNAEVVVQQLRGHQEHFREVPGWRAFLAFALAKAGQLAQAATEFEGLAERRFPIPRDTTWLGCMAMLCVVCSKLRDHSRAALLYEALAPFAARHAVAGAGAVSLGSMHHFLGLLSSVRGDPHSASEHFEAAISSNTRMEAKLCVAYTQHEYASLLRASGSCHDPGRAEALEKLALETARACGAGQLEREIAEARSAA